MQAAAIPALTSTGPEVKPYCAGRYLRLSRRAESVKSQDPPTTSVRPWHLWPASNSCIQCVGSYPGALAHGMQMMARHRNERHRVTRTVSY